MQSIFARSRHWVHRFYVSSAAVAASGRIEYPIVSFYISELILSSLSSSSTVACKLVCKHQQSYARRCVVARGHSRLAALALSRVPQPYDTL
jgi:hypothetical protein